MTRQVIFVHVPRCAGTSIESYGRRNGTFQKYRPKEWDKGCWFTSLGHLSSEWYLSKGHITEEWWDRSIKLAVVRNPWDRLVSLYAYWKGIRFRGHWKRSNVHLTSFEEFATEVCSGCSRWVGRVSGRACREFGQANPQVEWLRKQVDVLIRFENLEDEWCQFCRQSELPQAKLGKLNKSRRGRDYWMYYTDDLVRKVGRFYREDVERFEYCYGS